MAPLAIITFVLFFLLVIGFSLWKSRKPKGSDSEGSDFFLGGRSLSWPIIGISIVAANISSEQMVGMAGAGAAAQGLAVSSWQLMGSVFIVIVSMTLLPKFLKAGIYTMPEFLEYRYNGAARTIMAILTVVIYVCVLLTAVLYTGATLLSVLLDIPVAQGVWIIGILGTLYSATGGLKAIAYADLIQGIALLVGGMIIFFVALDASGGWEKFSTENSGQLKMLLFKDHPGYSELPWYTVFSSMWIVMIYYTGLNQFIIQRNLAAKTLKDGQLGMIFAGALWLLVPFAIVMPGIMAANLFPADLAEKSDRAYPTLIKELISPGLRGFIFAAITGAIVSTLASLLNSASTIASMDVYKRLINPAVSEKSIVALGRLLIIIFVVTGCLIAPFLDDNVFTFIQKFQGFIWPGVVAAFIGAFIFKKAPAACGAVALLAGPILYTTFQVLTRQGLFESETATPVFEMHYLTQVLWCTVIIFVIMGIMTAVKPLATPKVLPVRAEMDLKTEPVVKIAGGLVIFGVALFFIIFR